MERPTPSSFAGSIMSNCAWIPIRRTNCHLIGAWNIVENTGDLVTDVKQCDLCGKMITTQQDMNAVTMNVNGGCECTQDDDGTDYDLHESCWKKIKKILR